MKKKSIEANKTRSECTTIIFTELNGGRQMKTGSRSAGAERERVERPPELEVLNCSKPIVARHPTLEVALVLLRLLSQLRQNGSRHVTVIESGY